MLYNIYDDYFKEEIMARKQKFAGGTANEIARVAVKEFFEKGFDGTSMRSIADAAGCEAGLIYYYYKTKDDLFSTVLDNFFSPYRQHAETIVDGASQDAYKALYAFFRYMKSVTREFREKYSANMHRALGNPRTNAYDYRTVPTENFRASARNGRAAIPRADAHGCISVARRRQRDSA